jgi:hypothetical protein
MLYFSDEDPGREFGRRTQPALAKGPESKHLWQHAPGLDPGG